MKIKVNKNSIQKQEYTKKLMEGQEVELGKRYRKIIWEDGLIEDDFVFLHYEENLYVFMNMKHTVFLFCSGDISCDKQLVFVGKKECLIHFDHPIEEMDNSTDFLWMRNRFPKMPPKYLKIIVQQK